MQLPISNVINISVSQAQTGIGDYNVNNLAIFSNEPVAMSFGSLGYQIYLSPQQVGVDFGTNSKTFAMANSVFSQQPNVLAGGGYLAVILTKESIQTLSFSGISASGSFQLHYGAGNIVVQWNDTAATIQTNLRALSTALAEVVVSGSIASQLLTFHMNGIYAPTQLSTSNDTLQTSGLVAVTIIQAETQAAEDLHEAIARSQGLIQYFGIMSIYTADVIGSSDVLAAAAVVQPLNNMLFVVGTVEADIQMGGILDTIRVDEYTQTRGLYYGDIDANALNMQAAYAGRALSTNFNGSNTTETMHLKQLIGVAPDPSMTQSILNEAQLAGADCYVSLQGVNAVFTSGANDFFDNVYNTLWFAGALQVAGFNYLATSSTKVPQTEQGMIGLKGAYRAVCQQAVSNAFVAPGQWNSSTTFGNQVDFLSNVSQLGYYIYSTPVSQQSQTSRVARQAPLIQIAIKFAGAIQSSDVIVYVNP